MRLLYHTAEWRSLAKLRMHTDSSLDLLEQVTTEFGKLMRDFHDMTCSDFNTMELPKETAARNRREAARNACNNNKLSSTLPFKDPNTTIGASKHASSTPKPSACKKKFFNLSTPKFHFLGDYVCYIRYAGTTDSYSTQLVSFSLCLYTS